MGQEYYTKEQVEDVAEIFRALPKIETPSKKTFGKGQVIRELTNDIRELIEKGYTYEQIVETFNSVGMQISLRTVKQTLAKSAHIQKSSITAKKKVSEPQIRKSRKNPDVLQDTNQVVPNVVIEVKAEPIELKPTKLKIKSNAKSKPELEPKPDVQLSVVPKINPIDPNHNVDAEERERINQEKIAKHFNHY